MNEGFAEYLHFALAKIRIAVLQSEWVLSVLDKLELKWSEWKANLRQSPGEGNCPKSKTVASVVGAARCPAVHSRPGTPLKFAKQRVVRVT